MDPSPLSFLLLLSHLPFVVFGCHHHVSAARLNTCCDSSRVQQLARPTAERDRPSIQAQTSVMLLHVPQPKPAPLRAPAAPALHQPRSQQIMQASMRTTCLKTLPSEPRYSFESTLRAAEPARQARSGRPEASIWKQRAGLAPELARCSGLQDLLTSLALTEAIYKVVTHGRDAAAAHFASLLADLQGASTVIGAMPLAVWWSAATRGQRYCHTETDDALFVGVMGSLTVCDWAANLNVLLTGIWQPDASARERPAAHRGYLGRSQHIPIESLYAQARSRGKRLVLCGHSLGGAVAQLCALRLLQQLPASEAMNVSVIAFASPAVGNQALARAVQHAGWQDNFKLLLMPEDFIPRLMSPFRRVVLPQTAPSLIAALDRGPQPAVVGNIQPCSRGWAVRIRKLRGQPKAMNRGALQPRPVGAVQLQAAAQPPALSTPPWCRRLVGTAARAFTTAVRVAMAPVQAARTYVPLGHEVYLDPPAHGHGLHAAILEGMQRSLVCPTAHRMPSHRARILDIIHACAAPVPDAASATQSPGGQQVAQEALTAAADAAWRRAVRAIALLVAGGTRNRMPDMGRPDASMAVR